MKMVSTTTAEEKMSRDSWVAPHVQRLFESGSLSGLTEWQLLDRFARIGDQGAFELLVTCHGPMVLGVCRRILDNAHDVDDAFQATFLVLIRRARSLGPGDVLAAWLHGVALKVARRARVRRERLLRRERTSVELEALAPALRTGDFELRAVLDQEIDRLPWKYQAPVALCYLQGLSHEETARQLGWPIGTVKGRLARARTLLGSRLSRRGITSSAGAVAGVLGLGASLQAAPSESLVAAALRVASRIADGRAWDAVVSTSIADLVRGVFTAMLFSKLKIVAALLMISGFAVAGAGVGVFARPHDEGEKANAVEPRTASEVQEASTPIRQSPTAAEAQEASTPIRQSPTVAEAESTPTPDTELRGERTALPSAPPVQPREDVADLHNQLIEAAERAYHTTFDEYREKQLLPERVYRASRLLLDARLEAATNSAARTDAYKAHLERMDALSRVAVLQRNGNIKAVSTADETKAFRAEARLFLAKSDSESAAEPTPSAPESDEEGENNPRTAAILAKLNEPLAMKFPYEQPLQDVLKYIKQATKGSKDNGIPIYIDPIGLSEAEKTMTSPVSIDVEGVPLRRTLQLILKQINLAYYVDDGLLVITSKDSTDTSPTLGPSMAKASPLLEKQMKARRGELSVDELTSLIAELKLINQMEALLSHEDPGPRANADAASSPMTAEQAQALLDQMKELTAALKASKERPHSHQ
jgi:RNA polymerase sigma factor (sigma-70 family)